MPPRDEKFRLTDVLHSIDKINRYVHDLSKEQFLSDEKTIDAVLQNLSVIGEAANHLSTAFCKRHAEVPWSKIIGMRNFLVHEYFGISSEIVWVTIQSELKILERTLKLINSSKNNRQESVPVGEPHPWRLCPLGQHWVRLYKRSVTPSQSHPDGKTLVRAHCQRNPSHKDVIYADEINEIAKKHFSKLKGPPCPDSLERDNGGDYDDLIRGWTKYWNEVLSPTEPLDPNLVKALIATESDFNPNIIVNAGKKQGMARGLMQVTDASQHILKALKGELKNHLVVINQDQMLDPNCNIAAGIRWLFRKMEIAQSQDKNVSWLEAIEKYKALPPDNRQIKKLKRFYAELIECKGFKKA